MTTPPLDDVRALLLRAAADQEGRTRHWRDCAVASASNVCGYPKEARDACVAAYERKVRDSEEVARLLRALAAAFGDGAVERVAMAMEESESLGAMQARDLAALAPAQEGTTNG